MGIENKGDCTLASCTKNEGRSILGRMRNIYRQYRFVRYLDNDIKAFEAKHDFLQEMEYRLKGAYLLDVTRRQTVRWDELASIGGRQ